MLLKEGHAGLLGEVENNSGLSQRRKETVKEYLTKRGIEANRLEET